jgi:hypothetical protein
MKNAAPDFIKLLLSGTEHPLYICSLSNERTLGNERHILSRDPKHIASFIKKHDVPGRAVYYCVSTIPDKQRRNAENAAEIKIVFADIDFKDIIAPDEALSILKKLPVRPNRVHKTGHGLHAIWFLKEPAVATSLAISGHMPRVIKTVKRLCDVLGADRHVCHPAALLRMPGTHNSKDPEHVKPVTSVTLANGAYGLEDIEKWLETQDPVIHRKDRNPVTNPCEDFIKQMVGGAPIDVDARLAAMEYRGVGEKAIHTTQVACSASQT